MERPAVAGCRACTPDAASDRRAPRWYRTDGAGRHAMPASWRWRSSETAHVPAPTSWLTFLHLFGGCFNAPSQLLFEQFVTAWALCPGRRTLTRIWSVIPPERRRRYGAYARWDREGHWSMAEPRRRLVVQAVGRWHPDGPLPLL